MDITETTLRSIWGEIEHEDSNIPAHVRVGDMRIAKLVFNKYKSNVKGAEDYLTLFGMPIIERADIPKDEIHIFNHAGKRIFKFVV